MQNLDRCFLFKMNAELDVLFFVSYSLYLNYTPLRQDVLGYRHDINENGSDEQGMGNVAIKLLI